MSPVVNSLARAAAGAVIVDPSSGRVVASAHDCRLPRPRQESKGQGHGQDKGQGKGKGHAQAGFHLLHHAVMVCIDAAAREDLRLYPKVSRGVARPSAPWPSLSVCSDCRTRRRKVKALG